MESRHIKGFAFVIMAMVALMLCSLVFQPTNLSPPHQLGTPFTPQTLSVFFLCNIIIVAVILTTHLGSPRNCNGVTAHDDRPHVFMSTESFCGQEMHYSEDHQLIDQTKFIYNTEDAIAEEKYCPMKSEKMGCRDIVEYTENCHVANDKFICSSVTHEKMQLVKVPAVIDSKYNELASMIDGDFNRTVEEFISEFKRQLRLQRQQSIPRRKLHP